MQITLNGADLLSFIKEEILTKEEVKKIILSQYGLLGKNLE